MSERQETMYVVMSIREMQADKPVKVFDDRKDARDYAKRMNQRSKKYGYYCTSVKRG